MAIQNISVPQGTSKTVKFTIYNNVAQSGNEFDLTNWVAKLWVVRDNQRNVPILKFNSLDNGGTNGVITLNLIPSDTDAIHMPETELKGYYQLVISNTSTGEAYRPFEGDFIITRDIITT